MQEEFGVAFRCVFTEPQEEMMLDRFIDYVESKGWQYGGGWMPTGMEGVVEFHVADRDEVSRCRLMLLDWFDQAKWIDTTPVCRVVDVNTFDGEV